ILIIYDEMDIFNVVRSQDNYLFPRVSEVFSYQLYDFKLQSSVSRFQFDDFVKDNFMSFTVLSEISFETSGNELVPQKRLLSRVRTLYRKDDLSQLLSIDKLESMNLPGESFKLTLTSELAIGIYQKSINNDLAQDLLPNL